MIYFEDVTPGDTIELGSFTFTAEAIRDFAVRFDPQPFHIDEEAAKASPYGGLIASGWHVAAIWMQLMVAHWQREALAALTAGTPVAELGPSPGFRDMLWLQPVRAGDTLRYVWEATGGRASASRPGWGLVTMRNRAFNQTDVQVFQFDGAVFWQGRPE